MAYGPSDFYGKGDWNAQCWECGRKFKASQLKKHWQGYWVCPDHWEERQPQDFVRNVPDVQTPPWQQPWPAPIFATFCTPQGVTAIASFAVADCVIADFTSPAFNPAIVETV